MLFQAIIKGTDLFPTHNLKKSVADYTFYIYNEFCHKTFLPWTSHSFFFDKHVCSWWNIILAYPHGKFWVPHLWKTHALQFCRGKSPNCCNFKYVCVEYEGKNQFKHPVKIKSIHASNNIYKLYHTWKLLYFNSILIKRSLYFVHVYIHLYIIYVCDNECIEIV